MTRHLGIILLALSKAFDLGLLTKLPRAAHLGLEGEEGVVSKPDISRFENKHLFSQSRKLYSYLQSTVDDEVTPETRHDGSVQKLAIILHDCPNSKQLLVIGCNSPSDI
jgi:hypothetical protein